MRELLRRLWRPSAPATLSSLSAYERWADAYPPHAHNALMQAEEVAMLSLLPALSGLRLIDLASGTGRYGQLALEQGASRVVALDNSPAMLHHNRLAERALATSEALPLPPACMDGVICGLALGHLPSLAASLAEISRVLRPGGWALISDFHPFIFLNGQRRTFTAPDGRTYAVEHHVHLYADYHSAAGAAGLVIEAVLEPRLGLDTTVRFASAATAQGTPVVLVLCLRKPV